MLQMSTRFNYTPMWHYVIHMHAKILDYIYFLVKCRLIFELSGCNNLSE